MSPQQISLNFSDIPEQVLVPRGKYVAQVDHLEVADNSAGDGQNIIWHFTGLEGPAEGQTFRMFTSLKPNGLWRVKAAFEAFGVTDEALDLEVDEDSNYVLNPDLNGQLCVLDIGIGMYNGRKNNQVNNIQPMEGGTVEPIKDEPAASPAKKPVTPPTRKGLNLK